jgi:myo-inositol-1(or 4)-monophosphatase
MGSLLVEEKKSFSELTSIAIEAAISAGGILRSGFGTNFQIQSKEGHHNLVTEYDHKAEKSIIEFISKRVPNSHFLAEESGESGMKDLPDSLLWVIDPLDGTVNFAHNIPFFSVSIGVEKNKEIISGVVYLPMTDELFVAQKGLGAFMNGERLHVSSTATLGQSILATGFPYNLAENPSHCIDHFIDILRAGIPIRRLGSAAIDFAYTAAGRFDGFFEISLSPWDCAAGKLLVEEAGGIVSGWDGSPFIFHSRAPVLATNGRIHTQALTLLNQSL